MTTQKEPKNVYFRSYYTQAKKLYLEKKYMQAAELYSRSLEIYPNDKHCLVARSKCFQRLGKPAKALADTELALQQDENFAEAVYQKAEAYYQQSNYEVALLVFHRGLKFPGRPDLFLNGIHKCEEAIEKSVLWLDQLPIYRSEEPMDCGSKEGLGETMTSSECITAEPKVPTPHRDKVQNLLEEIYHDRKFLKKLLKNFEFKTETDWLSKLMIIDRLIYLNNQAKYLQTQKLAYRTGNASIPQNIKDDLEEIQSTFCSKRYKDCIKECIRMTTDYENADWDLKRKFILKLYSWIGASNMELKQWENARCAFLALLWIGEWCKDDELRLKALGAISLCYKNDTQYKPNTDNIEGTESGEMSEIEEMDLYYYLGQCYLGLNNKKAHGYGHMCYDTAVVGSSKEFMKASLMLMAYANMKIGNYEGAVASLKECQQLMDGDSDSRMETVEKALSEVSSLLNSLGRRKEEEEQGGVNEKKEKDDEEEEEEKALQKRREEAEAEEKKIEKQKEDEEKGNEDDKDDDGSKKDKGGGSGIGGGGAGSEEVGGGGVGGEKVEEEERQEDGGGSSLGGEDEGEERAGKDEEEKGEVGEKGVDKDEESYPSSVQSVPQNDPTLSEPQQEEDENNSNETKTKLCC